VSLPQYMTKFQWDLAKYPIKQSLKNISDIISKVSSQYIVICYQSAAVLHYVLFLAVVCWNRLYQLDVCGGKASETISGL